MSTPQVPTRFTLLESVRRGRGVTRGYLGQLTGLSRSVVAQVVSELMAEGLLTEGRDAGHGGRGRPSSLLRLAPQNGIAAGIDIGHRHISVILSELDGSVLGEEEIRHDVDADATLAFTAARRLLESAVLQVGSRHLVGVGLALPFPVVGPERAVRPVGEVPAWEGVRPRDLIRLDPRVSLVVDNDADAGAWGELRHDPSARSLLFVKVGEGLGSALAVEGEVFRGAHGMAGEIGHVLVPESTLPCRCGRTGCLDAVVTRATAPEARPEEIEVAGRALGAVLAQLASFVDPDVLVLGGTVGAEAGLFADRIAASYEEHSSRIHRAALRPATLGRRSELHGALDRGLHHAWTRLASMSAFELAR